MFCVLGNLKGRSKKLLLYLNLKVRGLELTASELNHFGSSRFTGSGNGGTLQSKNVLGAPRLTPRELFMHSRTFVGLGLYLRAFMVTHTDTNPKP